MAVEIEHKFEVVNDSWKHGASEGIDYSQAYMNTDSGQTVRVRTAGPKAYLTIKGKVRGISRTEFEYEIPRADAEIMLRDLCVTPVVVKTRYLFDHEGKTWEIDVFAGDNSGLVIAEIELESEDEKFALPSWAGKCLSGEKRFRNSQLARKPYSSWSDCDKLNMP